MCMKKFISFGIGLTVFFLFAAKLSAQWSLDIETGRVWSGYNDVQIPGDTGTRFSLSKDLKADAGLFLRARLTWQIKPRHALSLFAAPLSLKASGSVAKPLFYNGEEFAAATPLKARYVFNSYRLTYRYTLVPGDRFKFGIGLTAKIRDAGIRVEGGGKTTEKTNVGVVPLINFRLDWMFSGRTGILLEGDALAAPQGRAEDVFLGIQWKASKALSLRAGYRIVEGGADNDKVYNFALINFLAVGAEVKF